MANISNYLTAVAVLFLLFGSADPQARRHTASRRAPVGASTDTCVLNGTYRVNAVDSDRLYSVVRSARSMVPFSEQQQFFIDLSTRLTPPDMLAIECRGNFVSVGSSRANKITYLADGKNRRERLPNGGYVNSKVTLASNRLSFVSVGRAEDNIDVAFESLADGRLRVTRRIYAKQLAEPIVIRTFYDRLSDGVDWRLYEGDLLARQDLLADRNLQPNASEDITGRNRIDSLRRDFAAWLDATNRRDIDGQMRFYMPQMKAYYLARNAPQRTVRLEKERVFGRVRSVDIRAGEPEIIFQSGGRVAVMRFVKEYKLNERSRTRDGAVIQELRWQRTTDGWRIFSERDVRVIR